MRRRWLTRAGIAALAAAAALGAAACGGDDDDAADTSGGGERGPRRRHRHPRRPGDLRRGDQGRHVPDREHRLRQQRRLRPLGRVLRLRLDDLQHDHAPDPREQPRSPPATPARSFVPDIATEVPEASADGLTYTFTLKDGITFGPPVNREVTSQDIKYSFERIGTPSVAAQYAFYYNVIEGMEEFAAGEANTISGHHDARRQDHHLQADAADGRLPLPDGDAGDGADPGGGRQVPHPGGRVRALHRHHRPLHDRGRRQARHLELRQPEADLGLQPEHRPHAGAQPELRPGHRQHRVPAEQPRPVRDHGQHQPRQHLRPDRARRAETAPSSRPRTRSCGATCRTRRSASACASTRATASGSPT